MTRPQIGALALVGLLVAMIGSTGCNNKGTTEGKGGEKLTLSVPKDVTLTKGGEAKSVDVSISRTKFNEPVTIEFKNLPPGVKIAETDMVIPKDKDKTTFNLKADDTAAEKTDHVVTITATAGGAEKLTQEQTMKVTVKKAS